MCRPFSGVRVWTSRQAMSGMNPPAEVSEARAQAVRVSDDALTVDLVDGRTIIVPLMWYPRLWHATRDERSRFEVFGDGVYIHWPGVDEDLTVTGLLQGRRSGEGTKSLKAWHEARRRKSGESASGSGAKA